MRSQSLRTSLQPCCAAVCVWGTLPRNRFDHSVTSVRDAASTPSARSDVTASLLAICSASVSERAGLLSRICRCRVLAVWLSSARQRISSSFLDSRSSTRRPPYFPANSRLTVSLTIFPSTRISAPANLAITFFITVPMSFMVGGEPISAMTAFTPATMSASLAALGR